MRTKILIIISLMFCFSLSETSWSQEDSKDKDELVGPSSYMPKLKKKDDPYQQKEETLMDDLIYYKDWAIYYDLHYYAAGLLLLFIIYKRIKTIQRRKKIGRFN